MSCFKLKLLKYLGLNGIFNNKDKYSKSSGYFTSGGKKDFVFQVEIRKSFVIIKDEDKY